MRESRKEHLGSDSWMKTFTPHAATAKPVGGVEEAGSQPPSRRDVHASATRCALSYCSGHGCARGLRPRGGRSDTANRHSRVRPR